jgi:hypothetical protein
VHKVEIVELTSDGAAIRAIAHMCGQTWQSSGYAFIRIAQVIKMNERHGKPSETYTFPAFWSAGKTRIPHESTIKNDPNFLAFGLTKEQRNASKSLALIRTNRPNKLGTVIVEAIPPLSNSSWIPRRGLESEPNFGGCARDA